jgi:hypothetical protein
MARLNPATTSGIYVFLVGIWFVALYVADRMGYQNAVFASALPGRFGSPLSVVHYLFVKKTKADPRHNKPVWAHLETSVARVPRS